MKTKEAQKYINAYNRLKAQVSKKLYSDEFKSRTKDLDKLGIERAQESYWKNKEKELQILKTKLEGYI